jgi:hypothetical protein
VYLGCKLIRGAFHLDIPFICQFRVIKALSVFSGVFIAEEVDDVGDKWSGDTTTADVQILLQA